MREILDSVTVN